MKLRKGYFFGRTSLSATERRIGRLLRAPDGHGEAGDPPAGEGGGEGAAERPEWLPEKFWTGEGPNVENLAKSYAELERTRGASMDDLKSQWEAERLALRPESADKYELPEIEALDAEQLAASPVVAAWRAIAHEAGLPQDAFNKGLAQYAEAEIARIEAQAEAEMAKLGDNAKVRAQAVSAWAQQTFKDEEEFAAIQQIGTSAAGVKVLERMMRLMRDNGGSVEDFEAPANQGDDLDTIRQLMNSREYWDPKVRDAKVVKRVETFFEQQARK
jgi:hypothetical protein